MVQGGMSCIKYLLFAFNLVFVIFGILLIWAGSAVLGKIGDYDEIIKDAPNNTAITLIVVGVIIFIIAFLGCCGAIKENYRMLVTFGGIILIILLVELIGAGLMLGFKSNIKKAAESGIDEAIKDYTNSTALDSVLDDMQRNLECCGAEGPDDWRKYNHTGPPSSCKCNDPKAHCEGGNYKDGCVEKFEKIVKGSLGVLGGICLAIALIQLFGIIFACCLARSIKKEYEVV